MQDAPVFWNQSPFDLRCEWGPRGLEALAAGSDAIVIVDVISFSTCVDIAVARGAAVYPYDGPDADGVARKLDAILVGRDQDAGLHFSATAMMSVRAGARLVLPSPNGGALAVAADRRPMSGRLSADERRPRLEERSQTTDDRRRLANTPGMAQGGGRLGRLRARWRERRGGDEAAVGTDTPEAAVASAPGPVVFAGCLRNARAVAAAAARVGPRVAVIAAGERWPADADGDRSLRPAAEDLLGAGAIIDALPGRRSPEAELAVAAFRAARDRLPALLATCSSGREHELRGTAADVALAAQLNVSDFAPRLVAGAFVAGSGGM